MPTSTFSRPFFGLCPDFSPLQPRLHDLFFREMPEYPTFAWQEALVNAVAHRDYRTQGRGVEVYLYDDRLEITSPGALPAEVDLSQLRRREPVHCSRNPRITRVLAELALMREQGEGIPRMFEEDYRDAFDADRRSALAALTELVVREVLVRTGERRGTRYRPGSGWASWLNDAQSQTDKCALMTQTVASIA